MKNVLSTISGVMLLVLICVSCSDDEYDFDVNPDSSCRDTQLEMLIDGEDFNWITNSYGWEESPANTGEVSIFIRGYVENDQGVTKNFTLRLPYEETGEDVVSSIEYSQNEDATEFDGTSTEMNIESNVITNSSDCFFATFSSTVTDGTEDIVITNGSLSFNYSEPIPF